MEVDRNNSSRGMKEWIRKDNSHMAEREVGMEKNSCSEKEKQMMDTEDEGNDLMDGVHNVNTRRKEQEQEQKQKQVDLHHNNHYHNN